MTAVDLTLDDEILSPNEVAPAAKAEAGPAGASTRCRYCAEDFDGGFRFAKRGMHEKKEHRTEWEAARQPGAKKVARAKKATKKAAPAKKPATRITPAKRISAADSIATNVGRVAKLLGGLDAPLSRALVFSAPATGQAVDELVAGTVVDKLVVQRIAAVSDKWERLGGVIAFPVLVAVISKNPALFPVLEDELREATMDVLIANIPTMEKKKAREKKAFETLSRLGQVDERYAATDDPLRLLLEDIFAVEIVADDADAGGGRHAAHQ